MSGEEDQRSGSDNGSSSSVPGDEVEHNGTTNGGAKEEEGTSSRDGGGEEDGGGSPANGRDNGDGGVEQTNGKRRSASRSRSPSPEGERLIGKSKGERDRDRHRSSRSKRHKSDRHRSRSRSRGGEDKDADKDQRESSSRRHKRKKSSRSRSRSRSRGGSRRDRDRGSSRRDRDRDHHRGGDDHRRRDRSRERGGRDRDRSDRRHRGGGREGRDGYREERRGGGYRSRSRDRGRDRDRGARSSSYHRSSRSKRKSPSPEPEPLTAEEKEALKQQTALDELTKDQRTVFVDQLVIKVREKDVKAFFEKACGCEVKNVIMMRDKFSQRHKGFAYVELSDLEALPGALALNMTVPDFQKFPIGVRASEAERNFNAKQEAKAAGGAGAPSSQTINANNMPNKGPSPESEKRKLYLGSLHANLTEDDVRTVLVAFGELESLVLHVNEAGESKGFAFATFKSREAAAQCLEFCNGLDLAGKNISVAFAAEPAQHAAATAAAAAAAAAATAAAGMGGAGTGATNAGAASWKLDEQGGGGTKMDSTSRAALMAKLGQAAGMTVPMARAPALSVPMGGAGGGVPSEPSAATQAALAQAMGMAPPAVGPTFPPQVLQQQVQQAQAGVAGGGMPPVSMTTSAALSAALGNPTSVGANPVFNGSANPTTPAALMATQQAQAQAMAALAAATPGGGALGAEAAAPMTSGGSGGGVGPVEGTPSACCKLQNMFDPEEETEQGWEMGIKEDVEDECQQHGKVCHSFVDTSDPTGCVYVAFDSASACVACSSAMHGRWFAGRQVVVRYMQPEVYGAKFPEAARLLPSA